MPYEPPPYLAELTLAEIADQVASRKIPPVENWAPEKLGESEMRIAADGTWYHEGGPITRPAMVRAFSGLLTRDSTGQHWLMTPFEKLAIEVDDAAFIAVDCALKEGEIAFRLNTDELVVAGPDNPLRAAGDPETPALYLMVRRGCEARLNRSTYTQLAEIALETNGDEWIVSSQGAIFSLVP
ncbi:hypothetical protein Ga0102493_1168 [Erythrobacter litoralis]|jgi:hypothetical protein|uniref:Proteophosphoglycan n=1 Tax=Erythrobacter litoralis TaxID=39960 RepID=A0A074N4Z9_9SPHN|nr:DUF1285 domain-containing protein [Erythrobacter litoralis]AOL24215.1 hypothetical protein Ga0102493_1168 [Erythrobacter litoralis]KEO99268.1 hypothetical protein EH32_00120 [Erythrobacter litoralis]MEE4338539.1 DUF1285 domain-containing protein [Erythrobacter sp.]